MLAQRQEMDARRPDHLDPAPLHTTLLRLSRKLPNDRLLARILSAWYCGYGALPRHLGLPIEEYHRLLSSRFPHFTPPQEHPATGADDGNRAPERDDLHQLLLDHCAGNDPAERWIAAIVTAACMGDDHLWQDLGLASRGELSALMEQNFPTLFARNSSNMKWKKFLYKQLCAQEGIYICRAPSCNVCTDFDHCFGDES